MDLVTLLTLCTLGRGTPPAHALCYSLSAACEHHLLLVADDASDGLPTDAVSADDQGNAPFAVDQWQPIIAEASRRFGVLEQWIRKVMRAESGGRTMRDGRPITSRAGAMGLMQVMPSTYAAMRLRNGLGADPYDPHDNILAGTAYLREMYDRYGYPGLFAAYNAGPDRLDDYLLRGRTLPDETWNYLATISSESKDSVLAQGPSGASPATPKPSSDKLTHIDVASGRALFFTLGVGLNSALQPPAATPDDPRAGLLLVPLGQKSDVLRRADESHE